MAGGRVGPCCNTVCLLPPSAHGNWVVELRSTDSSFHWEPPPFRLFSSVVDHHTAGMDMTKHLWRDIVRFVGDAWQVLIHVQHDSTSLLWPEKEFYLEIEFLEELLIFLNWNFNWNYPCFLFIPRLRSEETLEKIIVTLFYKKVSNRDAMNHTQSVIHVTSQLKRKEERRKNKINVVLMSLDERNELLKIQCTREASLLSCHICPRRFQLREKKKRRGKDAWRSKRVTWNENSKLKFRSSGYTHRARRAMETRLFHGALATFRDRARGSINARGHIHLGGANRINLRIYPRREVSSHSMKVKLSTVDREVVDREPC